MQNYIEAISRKVQVFVLSIHDQLLATSMITHMIAHTLLSLLTVCCGVHKHLLYQITLYVPGRFAEYTIAECSFSDSHTRLSVSLKIIEIHF